MAPTAPTSLPPLRRLAEYSLTDIAGCLYGIRELYWPPPPPLPPKLSVPIRNLMRAGRPRLPHAYGDEKVPDSGYASAAVSDDESDGEESFDAEDIDSDSSDALDELRADPFERAFAIKWITGLICRIDDPVSDDPTVDADDARELLLDDATALLALFSHHDDEEEFALTRSFSFPSNGKPVHIELNDAPLSSSDHTSVGLQSWGSAIILAERLCAAPASFGLFAARAQPLRVLELGAGTGLLSIAAAKLLPHATVVATDYHPATLANLAANLRTNFPDPVDATRATACALDWACPELGPLGAPFDVLLAADVVYHPQHARWIRGCVARILRRPGPADEGGTFHLIVPLRPSGRNEGMDRTIDAVFGEGVHDEVSEDASQRSPRLAILETTAVERQGAGVGRADEVGYRLFRIGWVSS
ncbi:S-adenosyl-L-methionine-dependent methyltransferase [Mycena latifolia]|nr:S-adenosyl-L-methionine-dependent methyltransferase [Mycena latifolia]